MKKEKSDIRIRFTKKMIQESLVELMAEKSILNIRVQEICDSAGISRSTFYTYYDDQYDLLRQIEEQTFRGIENVVLKIRMNFKKSGKISPIGLEEAMKGFVQYIAENNDSIQVLLSENGDYLFQKRFFRDNVEQFRELREVKRKNLVDDETLKCYSLVMAGGFLILIQDWLQNGMKIPVPKMAKILAGMVSWILK